MNFLLFLAPFSWGHLKARGFCFQSERLLCGREPNAVEDGTRKAEAVKLQDAGISTKQWPKKMSGRKRLAYRLDDSWFEEQTYVNVRQKNRHECTQRQLEKQRRGSDTAVASRPLGS